MNTDATYATARASALDALDQISELLEALPAPTSPYHLDQLLKVRNHLAQALEGLNKMDFAA